MEAKTLQSRPTAKDLDLLLVLRRGPMTIRQLMRVSCRFEKPYRNYEVLRRRLFTLHESGLVSLSKYYVPCAEKTNYYQLTPTGFRTLGTGEAMPSHSFFDSVGFANENHTFCLHEFLSRFDQNAASAGYHLLDFTRDRQQKLQIGDRSAYPDASFALYVDGHVRNYFLEIDCGTEPIYSSKKRKSLCRKITFYDDYWKQAENRFSVLTVFTSSTRRLYNFLEAVHDTITPPYNRPLFLATMLPNDGRGIDLIHDAAFLDHRKQPQAIVPPRANRIERTEKIESEILAALPA